MNLLGKATLQGDKTSRAPGTAEAFQKYLELLPPARMPQSAKDLLASIGFQGGNQLRHEEEATK